MLKGFKYRLYPTDDQIVLINKHIGACRFIYNLALETKQMAYAGAKINLSCFDLTKQLKDLKKECPWLKEVNSQSLQFPIRNLDNAFTRFFKGQCDYPKFKKKRSAGSFTAHQRIRIDNDKIVLLKFNEGIKINLYRSIEGAIKQATISRTATGKYFVSILCDTGEENKSKKKVKENTTLGIDLGLKDFLVTSDGQKFDNPKFLKQAQSKLKFIQRKFSKHKGKKTRKRFALLHEKVANQRKDFLHKTSTKLIRENQSLAIEDLNINGMMANHKLAGVIGDTSWYSFIEMLKYKADWYGKNILQIGRFEASSKTCSSCGSINKQLILSDRNWTCQCGVNHDRDINAAINIKNFALRNYLSGVDRKNQNELPTLVGVLTSEA